MLNDHWIKYYWNITKAVSTGSKDPSTKVGSVIIRPDKTTCSTGFNGFKAGMADDARMYADRDFKLRNIIHAEVNAINHTTDDLTFCEIMVYPLPCCSRCAEYISTTGITHVYCKKPVEGRWYESAMAALAIFKRENIDVTFLTEDGEIDE